MKRVWEWVVAIVAGRKVWNKAWDVAVTVVAALMLLDANAQTTLARVPSLTQAAVGRVGEGTVLAGPEHVRGEFEEGHDARFPILWRAEDQGLFAWMSIVFLGQVDLFFTDAHGRSKNPNYNNGPGNAIINVHLYVPTVGLGIGGGNHTRFFANCYHDAYYGPYFFDQVSSWMSNGLGWSGKSGAIEDYETFNSMYIELPSTIPLYGASMQVTKYLNDGSRKADLSAVLKAVPNGDTATYRKNADGWPRVDVDVQSPLTKGYGYLVEGDANNAPLYKVCIFNAFRAANPNIGLEDHLSYYYGLIWNEHYDWDEFTNNQDFLLTLVEDYLEDEYIIGLTGHLIREKSDIQSNGTIRNPAGVYFRTFGKAAMRFVNIPIDTLCQVSTPPDVVYNGQPFTPTVTVDRVGPHTGRRRTLTPNVHYESELVYANNIHAGQASVVVQGKGNYSGTAITHFNILPKPMADGWATHSGDSVYIYTGEPIVPTFRIQDGELTLRKDIDYTITPTAINVGTYTVAITGKGDYKDAVTSPPYTIAPLSFTYGVNATQSFPNIVFTGDPIRPTPSIFFGTRELRENTDYTLVYSNNINAGQATLQMIGIGNFCDTLTVPFIITPKPLDAAVVYTLNGTYAYEGRPVDLDSNELIVRDGNRILVRDRDYEVIYQGNTDLGTADITISGINNYQGVIYGDFTIRPAQADEIEIQSIPAQTYTGDSLRPAITVIGPGGRVLVPGVDYDWEYNTNLNAGTAGVTITGRGDYVDHTAVVTRNFAIQPRPMSSDWITFLNSPYTFTGDPIEPRLLLNDGNRTLASAERVLADTRSARDDTVPCRDDTVPCRDDIVPRRDDTVPRRDDIVPRRDDVVPRRDDTVPRRDDIVPRRDDTVPRRDDIVPRRDDIVQTPNFLGLPAKNAENPSVFALLPDKMTENADTLADNAPAAGDNAVAETYPAQGVIRVTLAAPPAASDIAKTAVVAEATGDYEIVDWSNNLNAGEATVTLKGVGNYQGTITKTFTIERKPVPADWSILPLTRYNGQPVEPRPEVTDGYRILREGYDYRLSYQNNTNAGEAQVRVIGLGNYRDTAQHTFQISVRALNGEWLDNIPAQTYAGGTPITPAVSVRNGNYTLTEGIDYTISCSNNIDTGVATITVSGLGNYRGVVERQFAIYPKTIEPMWLRCASSYAFTGLEQRPVEVWDGARQLVEGSDYVISYSDNVHAGQASVSVSGLGNYTGSARRNFTIETRTLGAIEIPAQVYSGGDSIYPTLIKVAGSGEEMVLGRDYYVVACYNNVSPGSASLTIQGSGSYVGKVTAAFTIEPCPLSEASVWVTKSYEYTGAPITPEVYVHHNRATLEGNRDYIFTGFGNVINAGTGTATLAGQGYYTGSTTVTFEIAPRPLSERFVSSIGRQAYAGGRPVEPKVTVVDGEYLLVEGKDYEVAYANNVSVGTGTATVRGIGNYSGEIVREFVIMEEGTEVESSAGGRRLRGYVLGDGRLCVEGLLAGEAFALYNLQGQAVYKGVGAEGADVVVALGARGVYILVAGGEKEKVVY